MERYTGFVSQNVAPPGAKRLGVYDKNGNRVGEIPLGNLAFPNTGEKLYSFGAISDCHLQFDTENAENAHADLQNALTFFNGINGLAFVCVCGDMTQNGKAAELDEFKTYTDTYCPDKPVYSVTGNHDTWHYWNTIGANIAKHTGCELYYSVNHGDDVYIFVGNTVGQEDGLFTHAELQWLYETLEANRNKRCFVFQHVRPDDACGNAYGIYSYDIWGGKDQAVFESLLRHYHNVILFHGHSHLKFDIQEEYGEGANVDNFFGCHSIHIPSIAAPRDGNSKGAVSRVELWAESEGYVVDVYENGIHLRGRDFVKNEFLPIASYWLDTTLKTVEAGTYTDITGTITT
jgi:predicted phosphodiesterase